MFKNLLRSAALTVSVICLLLLAACGDAPTTESTKQTAAETEAATKKETTTVETTVPETTAVETTVPETTAPETTVPETTAPETTAPETPAETTSAAPGMGIVKINGGADEVGIYSVVVRLTDKAADKGVIEMVYYGSKGSPQEDSIVNTFRIEYYKEDAGTYEIKTFFNGEVYQNQHHKDEVKVINTFDAKLRAGSVIISYTPEGGDTQEIFRADAEYFAPSK